MTEIIKTITFVDPDIKARVVQLYMARCNFMHTVRFL